MKALTLTLCLAACWPNPPDVRYVYLVRHQHDAPLACAHLPPFPGPTEVCKPGWVAKVSRWIQFAGACLGTETFEIDWFIRDTGCTS